MPPTFGFLTQMVILFNPSTQIGGNNQGKFNRSISCVFESHMCGFWWTYLYEHTVANKDAFISIVYDF